MDALIVVDMQAGLLIGPPKHDLPGVIARINRLAAMMRGRSGKVVWIQHCGRPGDEFAPQTPGWSFLPEMDRQQADIVVRKTMNDPFVGTNLKATLDGIKPDRVLVTGWATDFCVDAAVRSAISNDYSVVRRRRRAHAEQSAASRRAKRDPASQLDLERAHYQPFDTDREYGRVAGGVAPPASHTRATFPHQGVHARLRRAMGEG